MNAQDPLTGDQARWMASLSAPLSHVRSDLLELPGGGRDCAEDVPWIRNCMAEHHGLRTEPDAMGGVDEKIAEHQAQARQTASRSARAALLLRTVDLAGLGWRMRPDNAGPTWLRQVQPVARWIRRDYKSFADWGQQLVAGLRDTDPEEFYFLQDFEFSAIEETVKQLLSKGLWTQLEWDAFPAAPPAELGCAAIWARQTCSQCRGVVPTRVITGPSACRRCATPAPGPDAERLESMVPRFSMPGTGQGSEIFGEHHHDEYWSEIRDAVGCFGCGAAIELAPLVLNCADEGLELFDCPQCQFSMTVQRLSEVHAAHFGECWAVGERHHLGERGKPAPALNLHLDCIHCAAGLPVDPSTSKWTCEFCQGVTQVPPRVWELVDPQGEQHPVYVVFRRAADELA